MLKPKKTKGGSSVEKIAQCLCNPEILLERWTRTHVLLLPRPDHLAEKRIILYTKWIILSSFQPVITIGRNGCKELR